MTTVPIRALSAAERRRRLTFGLLRSLAIAAALVAMYYLVPLDRLASVPLALILAVGLVALTAAATYQVRSVARAQYPALRAVEALSATAPLFLLLFAAVYFVMAQADASNFNAETLTRADSLYFTVTVFATVGFGDITATSEAARMLVTVQMLLDLIVLGIGIRVYVGAVEAGRQRASSGVQSAADHERPPAGTD